LFRLITFQDRNAEIGGIITIGDQVTKAAEHGIWTLLEFMAFLSLQLGAINLLPVPVLDGGHIFMNTIEIIMRRPISMAIQTWLYRIGAGMVFTLMGYGLLSDISRYSLFQKALAFLGFN
jgi:regulator of sigma E protease